ncbi:A/G-specific adenine glycosylase [Arundinibacter roseus]|uniref:Adenine DNA glycosylase n=1 Tax=Arundinibacter roseus TaxID=2070510 RepID=A0A4R4KCC2_9BACT|nr:A/G-specific adenine glycosylase [Arundinibacter roseus]TDB64101.1 A/G-specific adenine glycosylase [Arundinibacter roseus]
MKVTDFSSKLIHWYHHHHRDLPWRHTSDPYQIWLSEVILQQTRVAQGLPYYLRFVEKYPTVQAMAEADEQDILRTWQGLGYYSRARNMHQTARQIVQEFNGVFPNSYEQLLRLKGVGNYTAAAIASFAFGEAVPAVDGNVYRVLARLFGIKTDIASHAAKKEFFELAKTLIPADNAAFFNQAMIEFGAIQCQPVAPDCLLCPFQDSCYAFQNGQQSVLPVKAKKAKVRNRFLNYLVLEWNGKLAMNLRGGKDVWQGLYDFFLIETLQLPESPDEFMEQPTVHSWFLESEIQVPQKTYVHLLSHQKLHVQFWRLRFADSANMALPDNLSFFSFDQVEQLPKPILIDSFLKEHYFSNFISPN